MQDWKGRCYLEVLRRDLNDWHDYGKCNFLLHFIITFWHSIFKASGHAVCLMYEECTDSSLQQIQIRWIGRLAPRVSTPKRLGASYLGGDAVPSLIKEEKRQCRNLKQYDMHDIQRYFICKSLLLSMWFYSWLALGYISEVMSCF